MASYVTGIEEVKHGLDLPDVGKPHENGWTNGNGKTYVKTTKRAITRRAVLWLGQTCNLRCYFCYFLNRISDAKHPEHDFMTLEKSKAICGLLREFYGCTSIDIQGGEPTIYPPVLDLIRYCKEIGLYPTLKMNDR